MYCSPPASLSMRFPRQEYQSVLPFLSLVVLQSTSINVSQYENYYTSLCLRMLWSLHILPALGDACIPGCLMLLRPVSRWWVLDQNCRLHTAPSPASHHLPSTPSPPHPFRVSGTMEETCLITVKSLSGKLQPFQGNLA